MGADQLRVCVERLGKGGGSVRLFARKISIRSSGACGEGGRWFEIHWCRVGGGRTCRCCPNNRDFAARVASPKRYIFLHGFNGADGWYVTGLRK